MPHKPRMGAIFGIVSENGVAKEASPVYLLDMRRDMGVGQSKILAKQFTQPDGGFVFSGLDPDYSDYALMASDEDGAEPKNALIQDRVQPIPSHAGTGAFGDWYSRVFKDGATSGIVAAPVREQSPQRPLGLTSAVVYSVDPPSFGISIGVPEIPSMINMTTNKNGAMSSYGRTNSAVFTSASIELVLDVGSFSPTSSNMIIAFGGGVPIGNDDGSFASVYIGTSKTAASYGSVMCQLEYSPSSKEFIFYVVTGTGQQGHVSEASRISAASLTGLNHIVVTYLAAERVSLYANGVLLESKSTAVTMSHSYSSSVDNFIAVGGSTGNFFFGAQFSMALAVGYPLALTATQVLQHYNSLYNNNMIGVASGYAKEILKSVPCWYYRFDDTDYSKGFSGELEARNSQTSLSPSRSLIKLADHELATPMLDSPMLGRNTFSKPSSMSMKGSSAGLFGYIFKDQFSFTCWVNFNLETPSVKEGIVGFEYYQSNAMFFELYRDTDGKIKVLVRGISSPETITFAYTPASDTWINLWVVVDKTQPTNPVAHLYAGSEASEPVLVATSIISAGALYTASVHIGEKYNGAKGLGCVMGSGLDGRFCEVAMFPLVVTEDRIKEIWVSKDTP